MIDLPIARYVKKIQAVTLMERLAKHENIDNHSQDTKMKAASCYHTGKSHQEIYRLRELMMSFLASVH